jgi:hypothetical protein
MDKEEQIKEDWTIPLSWCTGVQWSSLPERWESQRYFTQSKTRQMVEASLINMGFFLSSWV